MTVTGTKHFDTLASLKYKMSDDWDTSLSNYDKLTGLKSRYQCTPSILFFKTSKLFNINISQYFDLIL